MITFEEAQRLLSEHAKPSHVVEQPLLESLGLALARPVTARADSPRFDYSAMDGYAISLKDFANGLPVTLPLAGTVHAGATSLKHLKPGSTHRILTGAPVPPGADAIVIQENVTVSECKVTFRQAPSPGAYIRKRGTELKRGQQLFAQGTVITPSVAQTLAACGYTRVRTRERPTVSVLVTGDELSIPGSKLKQGEIWDSNSIALKAAFSALGITSIRTHHVSDNAASTAKAVHSALERSDVVIATGGVSVGDRDYVKEAFAENGVHEIFWGVLMKPGKPLYFGIKRQVDRPRSKDRTKYVFGLPGNPVSVMVTYQLFVRRAILRMMGHVDRPRSVEQDVRLRGVLAQQLKKSDPRTEFVRAYREGSVDGLPTIVPLATRESNMTTGMAKADSLIVFPAKQEFLDAGSDVEIIPIMWGAY